MSLLSTSPSYPAPDAELEQVVQIAVSVSGRLARIHLHHMPSAVAEVLQQIAAATHADGCELLEFTPSGTPVRAGLPFSCARYASAAPPAPMLADWLVERLARGESLVIARPEDIPCDAMMTGTGARPDFRSMLAVPASIGGQVVCALVLQTTRLARRWPPALVERLRLLTEILGAGLHRVRNEHTLRANVAVIERLNAQLQADNGYLKEELKRHHDFDDIVGESTALRIALARVSQVAPANSSVLLLGPTGSGKELFARAVHERSRRHERPLVRVNCAALPPTLVESELFGHEKGAFTGAVAPRQGRFELADGGTIFLDEIGDLAPEVQVKFLRVLQEGEFERVGSSRTKKVDVRVIAATHQDLGAAVAEGRFRADLYYRLSVYPIRLPSLRERPDDIPRLTWFFIHRHQRQLERSITKVPQSVMDALQRHSWPGNVRELENVIERAMIASTGDTLRLDEASTFARMPAETAPVSDSLDEMQRIHIENVLERCGWRINGTGNAAERLGLHPNTLRFRMRKLGVMFPEARSRQGRLAPMEATA